MNVMRRPAADEIAPYRFTVADVEKMVAAGVLDHLERFELIEGEIVPMSPMHLPHARMTIALGAALDRALEPRFMAAAGASVMVSETSQLDPDITMVRADFDGRTIPLEEAQLIVEISDSTLAHDLSRKATLYAAAGAVELWVVDLEGETTHRHRGPLADGWRELVRVPFGEDISPLCAPDAVIGIADLA